MIYWLCHGLHSAVKKSCRDLKLRDSNFPGAGGLWPGQPNPAGISLSLGAVCASRAWLGAGSCPEHLEWFVPSPKGCSSHQSPAPQRFCALKVCSKAASNPPVFIINTAPFIRVHSSFCFLFLALYPFIVPPVPPWEWHREPDPAATAAPAPFQQQEFIPSKLPPPTEGLSCCCFFFSPLFVLIPSVFNPRQTQTTISAP